MKTSTIWRLQQCPRQRGCCDRNCNVVVPCKLKIVCAQKYSSAKRKKIDLTYSGWRIEYERSRTYGNEFHQCAEDRYKKQLRQFTSDINPYQTSSRAEKREQSSANQESTNHKGSRPCIALLLRKGPFNSPKPPVNIECGSNL